MASKRAMDDDGEETAREKCFFGARCYRKNPCHFLDYDHPHLAALDEESVKSESQVVREQWKIVVELGLVDAAKIDSFPSPKPGKSPKTETGTLTTKAEPNPRQNPGVSASKEKIRETSEASARVEKSAAAKKVHPQVQRLADAQPTSLFLTKVRDVPETHKSRESLFITDLLHPAHGILKATVQINFLVEYDFVKMAYEATGNQNIPLLILYGEENRELEAKNLPDNVKAVRIRSPYPFGTHHTKLMLFHYEDESVRVVVSTANLISSDWENRTQGLWVGPKCPRTGCAADSRTGFKDSLVRYLNWYGVPALNSYVEAIRRCDFSSVNAFFVASVPGSHTGPDMKRFGHMCAREILRKHRPTPCNWPLIVQCSSIGSLGSMGTNKSVYVTSELAKSLGPGCSQVQVVYPSKANVFSSLDGIAGGGCLPYRRETHLKQTWLRDHLYQWKSDKFSRSRAMPHIKTYSQVEGNKARFVLLTSANLSKAAWGTLNKAGDKLYIMSYEAGVLLLPEFSCEEDHFNLDETDLVLPYDFPLTRYGTADEPWFMNYLEEHFK